MWDGRGWTRCWYGRWVPSWWSCLTMAPRHGRQLALSVATCGLADHHRIAVSGAWTEVHQRLWLLRDDLGAVARQPRCTQRQAASGSRLAFETRGGRMTCFHAVQVRV